MINIKNIDIKYIAAAVFGILALILSIAAGIFSGNSASVVLFRTFTNTILFSAIGFICILVIKKYVPEVYQIFTSENDTEREVKVDTSAQNDNPAQETDKASAVDENVIEEKEMPEGYSGSAREDAELESTFNTFDKQNTEYSNSDITGSGIPKDVFKDNKVVYEPKIAAQAIRTMLKRDE